MKQVSFGTAAHALLTTFVANGIDRVFLVPGESFLGILDALNDFDTIDVVTCRHESSAGFMACADGRLTRRPSLVMVSRGPGATNASIALHTAQQDAVPLILVIGQVPVRDLRKGAFQELDYQQVFGSIAKWVFEATSPEQLAWAALNAVQIATSGTQGPVVLVVPEDVQHQMVELPHWKGGVSEQILPISSTMERIGTLIERASKPLLIAGSGLSSDRGREELLRFAEHFEVPVAVAFRQHDLFPNRHSLFVGELGLANTASQIELFDRSDLLLAIGTRMGDITTQGYRFPRHPRPIQTLVHCWPDDKIINRHLQSDIGVACDPVALLSALNSRSRRMPGRQDWIAELNFVAQQNAQWPRHRPDDGVLFADVVEVLARYAPRDVAICLDAGTFAAPVYKHFPFTPPQRLIAPQSGAMGYGVPSAIATHLRRPSGRTICITGDGGFLMTGSEINIAVARELPILFIVSNNNCYGSIRIHQERSYPGRAVGTTLSNPSFVNYAQSFGVTAELVACDSEIEHAIERGLVARGPYLIEVRTSLQGELKRPGQANAFASD